MFLPIPPMHYQKAWLSYQVKRIGLALGWLGIVSLVLALLLMIFYCFWMASLEHESQQLIAKIQEQQQLLRTQPEHSNDVAELQVAQTQDNVTLPSAGLAEANLQTLLQLANSHRLSLVTGQYQWKPNALSKANVAVYRLTLPLEGRYTAFRQFLHAAYLALPHLALTELTIQREQRDQETLAIQTVWEFYFDASTNEHKVGSLSNAFVLAKTKVAAQ